MDEKFVMYKFQESNRIPPSSSCLSDLLALMSNEYIYNKLIGEETSESEVDEEVFDSCRRRRRRRKSGFSDSEVDSSSESEDEENIPLTKISFQHLPADMTEEEFLHHVSPLPPHDYKSFVKADKGLKKHAFASAYVNFIHHEDALEFIEKFNGLIFQSGKGKISRVVVNFDLNQKVLKQQQSMDQICETIDNDSDYLKFLESFNSKASVSEEENIEPEQEILKISETEHQVGTGTVYQETFKDSIPPLCFQVRRTMDEEKVQSLKDLTNNNAALAIYNFHEITKFIGTSLPKVRAIQEMKKFFNQKVKSLPLPTRVKESLLVDLMRMCPEIWETHFQFYRVHGQVSEMRGHECHCSKEIDYKSHISLPDGRVDYRKSFEEVIRDKRTDLVCRFVLALHLYIPVDVLFYFFNQLPQAMQVNFIEKDVPLIIQYYDKKATTCGQFITKNGLFSLNFCEFIQKLLYEKGYMKTENAWPTAPFYRYLLVHKYKKSVIIY